ncbi:MAG: hypothetical protein NTY04_03305 [Candidatus Staskawiczbacteria bacterium]|nr:hypothetical protein [Candidatus Staskawiczbacteria bacterium]
MSTWNWLMYITNNEKTSRHEPVFDVIFMIINTAALIIGIYMFIAHDASEWIPILVIEYTWAFDNMRNNRNY